MFVSKLLGFEIDRFQDSLFKENVSVKVGVSDSLEVLVSELMGCCFLVEENVCVPTSLVLDIDELFSPSNQGCLELFSGKAFVPNSLGFGQS